MAKISKYTQCINGVSCNIEISVNAGGIFSLKLPVHLREIEGKEEIEDKTRDGLLSQLKSLSQIYEDMNVEKRKVICYEIYLRGRIFKDSSGNICHGSKDDALCADVFDLNSGSISGANLPGLLVILVVSGLSFVGLGLVAAVLPLLSTEKGAYATHILEAGLLLISGVYYEIDVLPVWIRPVRLLRIPPAASESRRAARPFLTYPYRGGPELAGTMFR